MKILITGSAGFIGFHLSRELLKQKYHVVGIDNFDKYYDVNLKKKRNKILQKFKNYSFYKIDIQKKKDVKKVFLKHKFDFVINLAAQAGVRYSLKNPQSYINSNILGFFNIIDCAKDYKIKNFLFASTSSVYGIQKKFPIKEESNTDNPIQLYAATKKSNELIAHAYSKIYKMKVVGLRFFTVYGPWGRPDMALFSFTKNILQNKKIDIFNRGNHVRDFTYIDDIIGGIIKIIKKKYQKPKYLIVNIGNGKKINLMKYIKLIELNLKKKAKKNFMPLQIGDVKKTHCDNSRLKRMFKYNPKTSVDQGVYNFVRWFLEYYKKKI